jgi:hypothetical protein
MVVFNEEKATIVAGRISGGQIPQANVSGETGYLHMGDGRVINPVDRGPLL